MTSPSPSPPRPPPPSPEREPYYIFVLGPPGAGKGTLCKRLALENGFYHLSVGDYLREICTKKSPWELFKTINPYVRSETLLPDKLMKKIVSDEILPMVRSKNTPCVIIDGFPRTFAQIPQWGDGVPHLVLYFDCPKDLAGERVVKRGRGGLSAVELIGIFELRYRHFQKEITDILQCYALENTTLPSHLTLGDAVAEFTVKVDTGRSTEESWAELQDKLAKNFRWNQILACAASNAGTRKIVGAEEQASPELIEQYAGDEKDEDEDGGVELGLYGDEDEKGNDADDERDDEDEEEKLEESEVEGENENASRYKGLSPVVRWLDNQKKESASSIEFDEHKRA